MESMDKRHLIGLLALVLSACSAASDSQATPPGSPSDLLPTLPETITHEPLPTILQPGPCEHLLWPLTDGASWHYQLLRADGSTQTVLLSAAVSGGSASLTLDMGGGPVENHITCAPDGFYGALGRLMTHPDLGGGLALANPARPFLPSADRLLPLGTQTSWDTQYSAGGTLLLPLAGGEVQTTVVGGDAEQSKVVLYATAQPLETISAPAGTFNALPVEQSALFNLRVTTGDGTSGSVFGDVRSRLYWVEGMGLVRQIFEGGMLSSTLGGASITLEAGITLDLIDYDIPSP